MSCDESFTRILTLEHACICHHEKRRERDWDQIVSARITNHNSTKSHRGLHVPGFQLIFNNGEGFSLTWPICEMRSHTQQCSEMRWRLEDQFSE